MHSSIFIKSVREVTMVDPIEVVGIPEVVIDGISDIRIIEGLVRVTFFVRRNSETEMALRLAIPLSELPDVIQAMVLTLTEAAKAIVKPALSS